MADFAAQTQPPMQKGLIQIITQRAQMMKRLRFIPVDGFSYRYNQQQSLGGIAFRALNQDYRTDPTLLAKGAMDTGIVNPETENLAIFGGGIQTDRQLVNKQGDAVRATRIISKTKRAGLHYDRNFFYGDPATDENAFTGLAYRCIRKQVIVAGDGKTADLSNNTDGPLTIAAVDLLMDSVFDDDSGKILCMNRTSRRNFSAEIRRNARGMGFSEFAGSQVIKYREAEVVVWDENADPDMPTIPNTEPFNGNPNTTSMFCVKLGGEDPEEGIQGLIGAELIEHVEVGLLGTFYLDMVESNAGLGVFHPRAAARLVGLQTGPIADLNP